MQNYFKIIAGQYLSEEENKKSLVFNV